MTKGSTSNGVSEELRRLVDLAREEDPAAPELSSLEAKLLPFMGPTSGGGGSGEGAGGGGEGLGPEGGAGLGDPGLGLVSGGGSAVGAAGGGATVAGSGAGAAMAVKLGLAALVATAGVTAAVVLTGGPATEAPESPRQMTDEPPDDAVSFQDEGPSPASYVAVPRDEPVERSRRRRRRARSAPVEEATVEQPAPEPPSESALLDRAQRALGSNPAQALDLTREHARLYPRGVMALEREVIAIDGVLRLGRREQAALRAARFLERHPRSAYDRRVRALLRAARAE